jgi:hypothetical protein
VRGFCYANNDEEFIQMLETTDHQFDLTAATDLHCAAIAIHAVDMLSDPKKLGKEKKPVALPVSLVFLDE